MSDTGTTAPPETDAQQLADAQTLITSAEKSVVAALDVLMGTYATNVRALLAQLPPNTGFPSQVWSFVTKTANNAEASRTNELAVIARYYNT